MKIFASLLTENVLVLCVATVLVLFYTVFDRFDIVFATVFDIVFDTVFDTVLILCSYSV